MSERRQLFESQTYDDDLIAFDERQSTTSCRWNGHAGCTAASGSTGSRDGASQSAAVATLSALETEETPLLAAEQPPRSRWRRPLIVALTVLASQYTITSLIVGVSVATTLRYFVTPQIVAKFEALAIALKR